MSGNRQPYPAAPDMPAFTLGRLAKLYGMHRSTVYEAVEKGRVSAGLDGKGQKVIDLAEAIRVWGEPPGAALQNPTPATDTHQAHPTDALQPLLEELRLLREEVAGLRAELRLIEHKPVPAKYPETGAIKTGGEQPPSGPARSFADLLKTLDG